MTNRYFWPICYLAFIVICNWMMVNLPMVKIAGGDIPIVMFIVGFVFVLRDLSQRAIGHNVLLLMVVAVFLSYILSSPAVAIASAVAFAVSELVDWAVYTYTKKPLSDRILYSSAISCPLDTFIFLFMLDIVSPAGFIIISMLKFGSAVITFSILRYTKAKQFNDNN